MKNLIPTCLVMAPIYSFAGPNYECKAIIFKYSQNQSRVEKIEKIVPVKGYDGRTRSLLIRPFDFTVIEPTPDRTVLKLSITDLRIKNGPSEISSAIAATPSNEADATLTAQIDNGSLQLILSCEIL